MSSAERELKQLMKKNNDLREELGRVANKVDLAIEFLNSCKERQPTLNDIDSAIHELAL